MATAGASDDEESDDGSEDFELDFELVGSSENIVC